MYILIGIIFIGIILFYLFYNNKVLEETVKEKSKFETQEVKEEVKEVRLYLNTDHMKYYLYRPDDFYSPDAKKLYKNIIVDQLLVEEPFHSKFVQIVQLIDKSDAWVKSIKSKELKLKIRKSNSKFEQGTSFKVYALSSLSFAFVNSIFEYFRANRSTKKHVQNSLLASLLFNINNIKEIKCWCENNLNENALTLCLANTILKNYIYKKEVINIIKLMQRSDQSVQFMTRNYTLTIQWQKEYPYVEKENQEVNRLEISYLNQPKTKYLISLDTF